MARPIIVAESDYRWLDGLLAVMWHRMNKAAVGFYFLQPATPVKFAVVNGHIRTTIAHVGLAVLHQINWLDDRNSLQV